jgi:hypothetical protein
VYEPVLRVPPEMLETAIGTSSEDVLLVGGHKAGWIAGYTRTPRLLVDNSIPRIAPEMLETAIGTSSEDVLLVDGDERLGRRIGQWKGPIGL